MTYILPPQHDVPEEVNIGAISLGQVSSSINREELMELIIAPEALLHLVDVH